MWNKKNEEVVVTLIVAFYNRVDFLRLVFAALKVQTYRHFEVIVADDGSSAESSAELEVLMASMPFPVRRVWHEDKGWRKNAILNKAVSEAGEGLLVFIDGDCVPERHFLQDHLKCARPGEVSTGRRVMLTERVTKLLTERSVEKGGLGRRLFLPLLFDAVVCRKPVKIEQMIRIGNERVRRCVAPDYERSILGCNFSIFKEDIMRINGFDERFVHPGYGEDIDLGNRLMRVGVRIRSRRRLMVMYHLYHEHLFTEHPDNLALLHKNKNAE